MNDPASTDDPLSTYALTYGIHPNAWKCTVIDNECPSEELECEDTGDLAGHCVFSSGPNAGKMPGSSAAVASGLDANGPPSIRIISKELLDGQTLEQFACACYGNGPEACPAGQDWAVDPEDCSGCGDDASTSVPEGGRCLDLNNDRVPDLATLQAGVATITCPGISGFGANGTYVTAQGDGYYYPSGNQVPTSGFGYAGIGPAIVIEPLTDLPTGADCTITISANVKDKDGNSFEGFEGASFTTGALTSAGLTPSGQTVPVATKSFTVNFNAALDPESLGATSVQIRKMGTTTFLNATVEADEEDPTGAVLTLGTGVALEAATTYEIVLSAAIADQYGQTTGAAETITFKTAAAAPPT